MKNAILAAIAPNINNAWIYITRFLLIVCVKKIHKVLIISCTVFLKRVLSTAASLWGII